MTDALDPLGRIAQHAAVPYDHPPVSHAAMEDHWRSFYHAEAIVLPDADLVREHADAIADVGECEAALAVRPEGKRDLHRRDVHLVRLCRLVGRRDALAAELARRGQG